MMRVEMSKATASLSEYARRARREPVIVMRGGKPLAALMPIDGDDWEDLVVASHPRFLALIARSRERQKPGEGIPLDEIKRKYGIKPKIKITRSSVPKAAHRAGR